MIGKAAGKLKTLLLGLPLDVLTAGKIVGRSFLVEGAWRTGLFFLLCFPYVIYRSALVRLRPGRVKKPDSPFTYTMQ